MLMDLACICWCEECFHDIWLLLRVDNLLELISLGLPYGTWPYAQRFCQVAIHEFIKRRQKVACFLPC